MNTIRHLSFSRMPRPLRWLLAGACIIIGVLGVVLPVIPGWPAFLVAVVLIGRRNRSLRHTHLFGRLFLRRLRRSRLPWLRRLGWQLSAHYVRGRQLVTPALHTMERMIGAG